MKINKLVFQEITVITTNFIPTKIRFRLNKWGLSMYKTITRHASFELRYSKNNNILEK